MFRHPDKKFKQLYRISKYRNKGANNQIILTSKEQDRQPISQTNSPHNMIQIKMQITEKTI